MAHVLYKGVDWRRTLTITDDTGARVNLDGKAVVFQLRRRTGEAALISLGVGTGITLAAQTGETLGECEVLIDGAASASLEVANHFVCAFVEGQVALAPLKLPVRAL